MEAFNELLRSLPFQFDIRTQLEDDLARLSQRDRDRLLVPLPLNNFTLYSPISFYDELGLAPVEYQLDHPLTPLELIRTVKKSYQVAVPKATLEYYAKKRPEPYREFLDNYLPIRPVLLSDLVGGRYYIDSLSRLDGGYLLNLIF